MLNEKLTLLIHSCDKFSDLWDVHFNLLNKNWADRNIATYLATDLSTDRSFDGVTIVSAGQGEEITGRITAVLPYIKTEYVLVTLDDYLDIYPISTEKIENLVDIMDKEELDYICIFNRPKTKKKFKDYRSLYSVDLTKNYRVNLYPGIWRKSFMEKTVGETLNAWMYEVSLTDIARKLNARCVQSKGNEFPIMDTVRKGKLLRKANKYLQKYNLYYGERNVRTRREEFSLFLKTWTVRLLPKSFCDFLKHHFKIKSFSGY